MAIIRSGGTCFVPGPQGLVNLFAPYNGLKADDRTPDLLGNFQQRVNLSNRSGYSWIPVETTKFKVGCHLMRGVVDQNGNVDVSCCAWLSSTFLMSNFGTEAFSGNPTGGPVLPKGSLAESLGNILEFPNVTDPTGWGSFFWQMRGQTPLGAAVWLELVSFDVPDSYILPAAYPVKNPGPSSLMMYMGPDGYSDSSPIAHSVTAHNSAIQSDGGAAFDGTSSYLSFDGSDPSMHFSGDFTIEMTIATTTQSLESGVQRRILSFGSLPSIGIGIDPGSGAAVLYNEYVAPLKTGGVSVCGGNRTTIKWRRESGVNALIINGQQDGQPFTDTTAWTASTSSEIGRLCGQNLGCYQGEIYNLNIVNGIAI